MKRVLHTTALAALMVGGIGLAASAQTASGTAGSGGSNTTPAASASGNHVGIGQLQSEQNQLYNQTLLSADSLAQADVYGANGNDIGNVDQIYVNDSGQIVAIGADINGGFFDLFNHNHIIVPWNQVKLASFGIVVPVTQNNINNYQDNGDLGTHPVTSQLNQIVVTNNNGNNGQAFTPGGVFRLSDLINDYATFNNGGNYGYVTDAYFNTSGQMVAVVVDANREYGGGRYAYPYYGPGSGWTPSGSSYDIGYNAGDVAHLSRLNGNQLNIVYGGNASNNGWFNGNGWGNSGGWGNNNGWFGSNGAFHNNNNGLFNGGNNNNGLFNGNNNNNGLFNNND